MLDVIPMEYNVEVDFGKLNLSPKMMVDSICTPHNCKLEQIAFQVKTLKGS
jgi:hypothetical protein